MSNVLPFVRKKLARRRCTSCQAALPRSQTGVCQTCIERFRSRVEKIFAVLSPEQIETIGLCGDCLVRAAEHWREIKARSR
jgi:hypothetical protein